MEKQAKKGGKGRSGEKRGRKRKSEKKKKVNESEVQYLQWKADIPIIYDWFTHHNLAWPSLSCRWGPQLEQAKYWNCDRLYFSEQTDGSYPNTLVVASCQVVKRRVAFADHISQFDEEADSPFVKKFKTIIHPGEINRIRELPQNSKIVATHTDSPDVLVWDADLQPDRVASAGAVDSVPDLILTGHKENAEFALAMCRTEPFVLSGGKDKSVIFWSIHDHLSSLVEASKSAGTPPSVGPRGVFQGHRDTIEDVQFLPSSAQEFCSVGDDSCLILWDARVGTTPIIKVEKAHNADLHCVDWNRHNENLILTGSADNTVRLFDRRKLILDGVGSPIHKFAGHEDSVLCVQWCPEKASVFGSSAEDGLLNIWDLEKVGKKAEVAGITSPPPGLFFAHAGHRNNKVVDFHWSPSEPWAVVSVSNDVESGGGGSLQIWRMLEFLYRPEEEVMAEVENFQSHGRICEG